MWRMANVTLSAQQGTLSTNTATTDANGNVDFTYTAPDSTSNSSDTVTVSYQGHQFTFDVGIYLPQISYNTVSPASPMPSTASIIPTDSQDQTTITGNVTYDGLGLLTTTASLFVPKMS